MIFDRSAEDEPLIPSERTIRMEMSPKKIRVWQRTVGPYECVDASRDEPMKRGTLQSSKASELVTELQIREEDGEKKSAQCLSRKSQVSRQIFLNSEVEKVKIDGQSSEEQKIGEMENASREP